ncbi:MAG TPA: ABC transporter permease [Candidatus Acidoferrales bacterium]|nr:ABC transporter permease [Candidatus Acidoferrales bacterium]
MNTLLQDIRYGLRMLLKTPGFTAVAVLTLALGIGANTAIFSLINAVLLKSLPVKNPQQLVLFQWDDNKWAPNFGQTGWDSKYSFSYPTFEDFRTQSNALSSAFAWVPLGFNDENMTVGINGEPTLANGQMITGEYFSGLGVTALLGRAITEADENPGAPRVAVISYAYWSRRFGRDRSIVGRNVTLNGIPFTVVGVMPPAFYGVQVGTSPDIWVPFDDKPNMRPWSTQPGGGTATSVYTARNWLCINIIGRLKDGVTRAQAQSSLDTLFHHIVTADWHPDNENKVPHLTLAPATQGLPQLQEGTAQPLYILMAAVGLVLLIACANVATLLLARATGRKKEISVRLAIGASRSRLIRQLLTESVLMSVLGGLLGLLFAYWGTHALVALMSNSSNQLIVDTGADAKVLLFTFAASVLTGILFGLAPAFRITRIELASAMKDTAANVSDARDKHRLGKSLIVAQVAASLVLMIGAGLFVRTLVNFEKRDYGFNQQNLLTFGLDPTRAGYHDARLISLYSQLLDRIQDLPGIKSATLMEYAPFLGWSNNNDTAIEGEGSKTISFNVRSQSVGPDFFSTLGIPIIAGRGINRTDTTASPRVAVVDETFAKKFFPGQNPVGHRFSRGDKFDPKDLVEIIGVAKNAELTDPHAELRPKAYYAYSQVPKSLDMMFFEVRAQGLPSTIISELRDTVRQADPQLPMMNLETQTQETSDALSQEALFARLTSVFGLLALLLAMIGLYGTMAYSVTRKTHEIGIRMALGANPGNVLAMVIRQGITVALIGVAIGVVAALGATRLVGSMMFGVTPYDPLTFLVVAAVLVAVAFLACFIPARRAMKVDPMIALRYE